MGIDKNKLAKMLAMGEAIKGDTKKDIKKNSSNDITFIKLIVTFVVFFFLLYLILNR